MEPPALCQPKRHLKVQSAYRKDHSMETALNKIEIDLHVLKKYLEKITIILIQLDLSAEFNTIDQGIVLLYLKRFGLRGTVLS